MAKKEEKKINPEKLKGLFKKKANPVEDVGGIKDFEKNENGIVNDKLNNRYFEFGGKKFIVLDGFDSSEFNKPTTKNPPNPQIFVLIKQGKTKNGKEWYLCEYKGRKFLIEEPALSYIAAKKVENGFEIDINKSIVVRTNDKGGLKLVPKVPPKLWFGLEEIKKKLAIGVNYDAINEIIGDSNLSLEFIEKSRYGKFIAIQPANIFHFDERHKIHIYPGKSVKEHGFENLSLIDFVNKYDKRLHFRAFEHDGKTYYRFYLKKIKNSFKEEEKKPISSEESENEMLLNALKNGPEMDSDREDIQTFLETLEINNLEKNDNPKISLEGD